MYIAYREPLHFFLHFSPGSAHYVFFRATGSGRQPMPSGADRQTDRQAAHPSCSALPAAALSPGPVSLDGARHPPKLHTAQDLKWELQKRCKSTKFIFRQPI